jgi:type III restriction/modification enzyme restriction subunit
MIPEVRHTVEFERVAALPRRLLTQADAEAWAAALTPILACPGSRAALRPVQAYALAEAAENHGAWLALPVGAGKTLISFLLPRLMNARRPLLVIPATLREKTSADFASYVGAWRAPNPVPRRVSFTELSVESGARLLEDFQPDLIIIDEADELASRDSSAVRRIDRYVVAHPDCAIVPMTGTPSRKSIMGYWHLLCWALRERAPVPMHEGEAEMWAAALDEKPRGRRVHPGPLGGTVASARAWYRARLAQTPGVVIFDGDSCSQPLTVRVRLAPEDPEIDRHFERFMVEQESPGGIPVSDPLSRWRIDAQLGCGVYLRYRVPPPEAWREARRELCRFVRDRIAHSTSTSRPLDTELQVLKRYADHPIVETWQRIKPTFEPETEPVWLSASAVHDVVAWLRADAAPGIVWCGCVELAHAIQAATRLAYYANQGKDQNGNGLHVAPPGRSLIASWHANKKGFNLQAWRRQLIVHPPQSAKWLEQIFGRSHRAGQDRPVTVDVLATSGGTLDGFEAAIAEARFARDTVGLTQKIIRAEIVRAQPRITRSNRFRWARAASPHTPRARREMGCARVDGAKIC